MTSFKRDRRRIIGMGLAAAGAACTGAVQAAESGASDVRAPVPITGPTYIVIYRPGPAWIQGKPLSGQSLKHHGRYMLSLYRQGVLRFAGGFMDDSGGAAVFTAADNFAAQAIVQADPAVTSRIFDYDLRPWRLVDWERLAKAQSAG